jgi:hypothetical protein
MEVPVKLRQAGDLSQLSTLNRVVRKPTIELPAVSSTLPLVVDPAKMVEIIEHGVSLAEGGKRRECINEIDEAIFNYFSKIANGAMNILKRGYGYMPYPGPLTR